MCRNNTHTDYANLSEATSDGNKFIGLPHWEGSTEITLGELESKRDEFWETAPAFGGHAEIWEALKSASEYSLAGDYQMVHAIIE